MKEDLRDFDGKRLFTERHAVTQPFTLSEPEYELYDKSPTTSTSSCRR